MRNAEPDRVLAVGTIADPGQFWIGLCLVCDKATVTSSIDFHCGVSQKACELTGLHFSQSGAADQCRFVPIADDAWFEMKEAAN